MNAGEFPSDTLLRAISEHAPTDRDSIDAVLDDLDDFIQACIAAEIFATSCETSLWHLRAEYCRLCAYRTQHTAPSAQYVGDCLHRIHARAMQLLSWINSHPYHSTRFQVKREEQQRARGSRRSPIDKYAHQHDTGDA